MNYFDIARDLANALNKSVNGAKALDDASSTPPQQIAAIIAEISAVANAASAAVNALRDLISISPDAVKIVTGANAIINVTNFDVQTNCLMTQLLLAI